MRNAFGREVAHPGDATALAEMEAAGLTAQEARQVLRRVSECGETFVGAATSMRAFGNRSWARLNEAALYRLDGAMQSSQGPDVSATDSSASERLGQLRERAVRLRLESSGGERQWAEALVGGIE